MFDINFLTFEFEIFAFFVEFSVENGASAFYAEKETNTNMNGVKNVIWLDDQFYFYSILYSDS